MNLYAILPAYAPGNEVSLVLAESDAEAMGQGVFIAAKDIADSVYFSPTAAVYRVAQNLTKIGDAQAIDAPREWRWAHPAVEENAKRCERCLDPIEDHIHAATSCDIWARGADGEVLTVDPT
jgi:hypothetical protein